MKPLVGMAILTVGVVMFMAVIGAYLLILTRVKQAGLMVSLLPITTHHDRLFSQYHRLVHSGRAPAWPIFVWRKLGVATLLTFLLGTILVMK